MVSSERCGKHERLLAERRRVLGEEHPETLTAMLDLADCLWAEGRLIAARKLEEQVVAGRRHHLGEKHFDTLKAIGKLAVTMAAQGELAEARQLQERMVEGMRELYGDTGVETLRAVNNLAGTISAQGDLDAACDLLEGVVVSSCDAFGTASRQPDGNEQPGSDPVAASGSRGSLCAAAARCGYQAPGSRRDRPSDPRGG
jgi:hypothetical protein